MTKHWTQTRAGKLKLREQAAKRKSLGRHFNSIKYDDLVGTVKDVAQTPSVDITRIQETAFRRGLVTAIECILRELH